MIEEISAEKNREEYNERMEKEGDGCSWFSFSNTINQIHPSKKKKKKSFKIGKTDPLLWLVKRVED